MEVQALGRCWSPVAAFVAVGRRPSAAVFAVVVVVVVIGNTSHPRVDLHQQGFSKGSFPHTQQVCKTKPSRASLVLFICCLVVVCSLFICCVCVGYVLFTCCLSVVYLGCLLLMFVSLLVIRCLFVVYLRLLFICCLFIVYVVYLLFICCLLAP